MLEFACLSGLKNNAKRVSVVSGKDLQAEQEVVVLECCFSVS